VSDDRSVGEMANEVLMRQAKARAEKTGEPFEEALEAVLNTEAGAQLRELRDVAHGEESVEEWQVGMARERAKERAEDLGEHLGEPPENPTHGWRAGEGTGPAPLLQALRRPHRGHGGGEYPEDRSSMQNDQTAQDATMLLVAFDTNHPEARTVSPNGLDRPFSPTWADAEQAGLNRVRRDTAMWWLVDNNMVERDEEAKNLLAKGEGLPDSDYGWVFRITDSGRELLEEA
jgi:hypothetical protein